MFQGYSSTSFSAYTSDFLLTKCVVDTLLESWEISWPKITLWLVAFYSKGESYLLKLWLVKFYSKGNKIQI